MSTFDQREDSFAAQAGHEVARVQLAVPNTTFIPSQTEGAQPGVVLRETATTVTVTGTTAANFVIEFEGWFKSNATTGGTLTPAFAQSVVGTTVAPTASPKRSRPGLALGHEPQDC